MSARMGDLPFSSGVKQRIEMAMPQGVDMALMFAASTPWLVVAAY